MQHQYPEHVLVLSLDRKAIPDSDGSISTPKVFILAVRGLQSAFIVEDRVAQFPFVEVEPPRST
jgi:hypothetical protein